MDQKILSIVRSHFQNENIHMSDNFIDIGGGSLDAEIIISDINEIYGLKLKDRYLLMTDSLQEFVTEYLSNNI